jgi:hypothetical protein
MAIYKSPKGHAIQGTLDTIPGIALINGIDDKGEPEYMGETDVIWDGQETQVRDGKILYVCTEGHEWTFDQLVKEEA